jgi:hypothetical protein
MVLNAQWELIALVLTMSYAYSNIQAFSPPISIPNSNDFKKTVNSLMKILNERGERGHLCFTPQFTENQSVLKHGENLPL